MRISLPARVGRILRNMLGETMKTCKVPDPGLISLAALGILAAILIAGCLNSAGDLQSQTTNSGTTRTDTSASATATAADFAKTTATAVSTETPSVTIVTLDPVGERKAGDLITITGTTRLPAGTNLIWQILPDTGTAPDGLYKDSTMSVMANNYVTRGNGTMNIVSVTMSTNRLVPGKYIALVAGMKEDTASGATDIGDLAGYTWFTLS